MIPGVFVIFLFKYIYEDNLYIADSPIKLFFHTLRAGFKCLLSDWRAASIQTLDDYKVSLYGFNKLFVLQTNWQVFRIAMMAVFFNHREYIRRAYNPSLHFYAVHSGVLPRPDA